MKNIISLLCLTLYLNGLSVAQVVHPKYDMLPIQNETNILLDEKITDNTNVNKALQIFNQYTIVDTVGVEEGDVREMLGEITDVEIWDDKIFVLDNRLGTVKIFDTNGNYIGSVGRPGVGPGELASPRDLSISSDNTLWIVDADRSISAFVSSDTGYVEKITFKVNVNPQAICTIDNHIYVYGVGIGPGDSVLHTSSIHKYSKNGEYVESFGELYKSDKPIVVERLSQASSMSCRGKRIFIQYRYIPLSKIIDLESKDDVWSISYKKHDTMEIKEVRNGREVRFKSPPDGVMMGGSSAFSEMYVITNFEIVNRNTYKAKYKQYLIHQKSGRVYDSAVSTGPVLAYNNNMAIVKFVYPYPHIHILREK